MPKKNVVILFGGSSSEHEVSRLSARSFVEHINEEKYNVILIGITKKGEWLLYDGDYEKIPDGSWENHPGNKRAFVAPDASSELIVLDGPKHEFVKIDAAIPVLHGKYGEDGIVQGVLESSGIPFVGCDVASSACCMDKVVTNTMLYYNQINKPEFYWFYYCDFIKNSDKIISDIEDKIESYPKFVKPSRSGSSVGISKVYDRNELIEAIKSASDEDEKIIVEECVSGKEVECAVLGNESPTVSAVGEIVPGADFYDYDDKYINDAAKLYVPARIDEDASNRIREIALKAYKIMGCRGLARIDFLIDGKTKKIFLNELNTFPGFTSISMYPKLMEYSGTSFSELVDKLIELALEPKR